MGKIEAICVSHEKGTQKSAVSEALAVENWGIEGDAHAGKWHRQVSLLSKEDIDSFRRRGADVEYGAFGENLVIEGCQVSHLPVGTRVRIGDVLLEITQIGKACHSHCAIYKEMGDCIMPRCGVFSVVLKGGRIAPGDTAEVIPADEQRPFTAARITMSDKGAAGKREDVSGPLIDTALRSKGYDVLETMILPDQPERLEQELKRLADQRQISIILTTGGTGFSERDRTPEATAAVCERMAPGIAEAIRAYSLTKTPRAMFSRGTAGIRGKSLIVNLPGSPRAVEECLDCILPALDHGLGVLRGSVSECARA